MDPLASGIWARFKANRAAYTLTILATLTLGILIGTVISKGVKGQEKKGSDATPLTIPSPQQLSNQFSQISKQLEPSVVNINTESTIKQNPHRRRGGGNPDQPDDQNPFSISFSVASMAMVLFASILWALESSSMPRAISSPTATWSRKPTASASSFWMIHREFCMTPK
jgi:S1-C subfamily serine protease